MLSLDRVCVLTNPESGRGASPRPALAATLTPAGIDWEVRVIRAPGSAARMAADAAAEAFDAVIACGGDGTVASVAEGLIGTDVPLGVLPFGTGNGFAEELGLPRTPIGAANLLAEGDLMLRRIDVGRINGRVFLLRAGTGLIASVDDRSQQRLKRRIGGLAYVIGAARALPDAQMVRYRIEGDGGLLEHEAVACIVANGSTIGRSQIFIAEGIDPSDGQLDALLFTTEHVRTLRHAAGAFRHVIECRALPNVPTLRGSHLTIDADPPQPVVADGEDAGMTPARVEVVPGGLLVLSSPAAVTTPIGRPAIAY